MLVTWSAEAYGESVRAVVRLIEDVVFGLCGLVVGWIVVSLATGALLSVMAVTVLLALGGRLLFSGVIWTAGAGLVVAGAAGAVVHVSDLAASLGT